MAVAEVPFDLAEVKLAAPLTRPGTVAKADVIARLCASRRAARDRGRARRVRQDDAARAVGRGRSASVRVGRARRPRRRRRGVPALHRGRDPPRRAAPARGVRRAVRPGRIHLGASASRASGARWLRSSARWCSCSTICTPSPTRPAWTCSRRCSSTSRPARRSRSRAGRSRRCRWPAGGRRDWCTRSAWRTSGSTSGRPGCCWRPRASSWTTSELAELTERTEGWPAGLYLAALSMQAGAPSSAGAAGFTGDDRFVSEYFRLELLSRLPPAEARFLKHTSVLDRMCGGLCDAVLETTRSAQHARDARAHERLRRAARPARRVVSLPPPVRRAAAQRARAQRAGAGAPRSTAARWTGASPTTCRRRRSSTGTPRVRRTPSPAWSTRSPCRSTTTAGWRPWRSGWGGSATTSCARYPALAVYGAWVRVLTGRPAEAERWLALADGATSTIPLSDGSATIEPWVATLRACMMPDGVERALADADLALEQLPPQSAWRPDALARPGHRARAARRDRSCDGRPQRRRSRRGSPSAPSRRSTSPRHSSRSSRPGREPGARRGNARGRRRRSSTRRASATTRRARSRTWRRHASRCTRAGHEDARAALARAHRLRPLLDHGLPWLTIQVGLELTRAHLALAEAGAARTVLTETERVLELRPHMGSLVEDARELRERVAATSGSGRRLGDEPDRAPSCGCFRTSPPISRSRRSRAGCSSRATPSRPRRSRSTASSASRRAARRSSAPSRSGCWRARSTRRRRISPWRDDAPTGRSG